GQLPGAGERHRVHEPRRDGDGAWVDHRLGGGLELRGEIVRHSESARRGELGDRVQGGAADGGDAVQSSGEAAGGDLRFARDGGCAGELVLGAVARAVGGGGVGADRILSQGRTSRVALDGGAAVVVLVAPPAGFSRSISRRLATSLWTPSGALMTSLVLKTPMEARPSAADPMITTPLSIS